jgi:nucleotide-binding universal stress UspA family protein
MTTEPERPPVVVGVEGTGRSRATIRAAAQEARCRDATLIAVMAYGNERPPGAPAAHPVATLPVASDERLAAETALRDAVATALGDEADRVELRAALGLAGRNLVDTARGVNAQLIVLAGRGSTSMLLGTVSQYVLRRAPCPVLVVPEGEEPKAPEANRRMAHRGTGYC